MSTPADYLTSLLQKGIRLWVADGQLRYQAPKASLSPEELARLRSMKDAIIAELPPIVMAAQAPLTFQQQWLLELMRRSPKWKCSQGFAFRLTGSLRPEILEQSWSDILDRHGLLHARVAHIGEAQTQGPDTSAGDLLKLVDISGESIAEKASNAHLLIRHITSERLDEALGPLTAAWLLRLSESDHILVLLIHRLSADCLSVKQLLQDLWARYSTTVSPQYTSLLQKNPGYRDYALWQQETAAVWEQRHASFWNEYLEDAQPLRWPVTEYADVNPETLELLNSSIGSTLSTRLRELSRQTRVLPSLVTLAIFVAAASRCCGQRDFVVPFNIAGRRAEHDSVVGLFSYIILLRMRLTGRETFLDLLQSVSREFYWVLPHQDLGRLAHRRPELISGVFCQWLAWHPADAGGPEVSNATHRLGLTVDSVRFQSAEDLTNVPPIVVDVEISFFEMEGDIQVLAIHRPHRLGVATLSRFIDEIRSEAERFTTDPTLAVAASDGQGCAAASSC